MDFCKYLGLPTSFGQSKKAYELYFELSEWKASTFLSLSGKEVSLNSIACAMPNYAM